MIGEELCCYWFAEASCLGFGFEGLDFITDVLVGFAACPFGLGREWLVDTWHTAKSEAKFCGSKALAADLIVFCEAYSAL